MRTTSTSSRSGCAWAVAAALVLVGLVSGDGIWAGTGNWFFALFIGCTFVAFGLLSFRENPKPPEPHLDEDILWPDDGTTFAYRGRKRPLRHPVGTFRGGGADGSW